MTIERYSTPLAFKTALEHRVRQRAEKTETHMNRVRQLAVFDRFLVRVFETMRDSVVLKGGVVLELRLERARTTKDIDLRVTGSPTHVLRDLQAAGRLDLGDYLSFEVARDSRLPEFLEGQRYGGQRFRVEPKLAGLPYAQAFGVDVGFADALTEPTEPFHSSDFFDLVSAPRARFQIYPLETHIAEKLHAYTLPRARPNSRVKDLPDLALLGRIRSLDAERLRAAIDRTFEHRNTHPTPDSLPNPPVAWIPLYARMASTDMLPWRTLDEVFNAASGFLDPILNAGKQSGEWSPQDERWKPRG